MTTLLGGSRGRASEEEAAADAEMDRRLAILDEIFGNFQNVFLVEIHEKLGSVLSDVLSDDMCEAMGTNIIRVYSKDCEGVVRDIKAGFAGVISDAIARLKPFWMETLCATVTAQAQVETGSGASSGSFSLSIPWLKQGGS